MSQFALQMPAIAAASEKAAPRGISPPRDAWTNPREYQELIVIAYIVSYRGVSVPLFAAWLAAAIIIGRVLIPGIPDNLVWFAAGIFTISSLCAAIQIAVKQQEREKETAKRFEVLENRIKELDSDPLDKLKSGAIG